MGACGTLPLSRAQGAGRQGLYRSVRDPVHVGMVVISFGDAICLVVGLHYNKLAVPESSLLCQQQTERHKSSGKTEGWRQNLLKHRAYGPKRVLVAVGEAGIIGFVRVGPVAEAGTVGLVCLLYVLPKYWRCGVGKTLISAAMGELRDLGMCGAVLCVLRDNQRARRF